MGLAFLFGQSPTRLLITLVDTNQGSPPLYEMDFLPWHDALDTVVGFAARQGYYKPYFLWQEGAFAYEDGVPIFPQSQAVYLLRSIPIIWSRSPYTRVRFDQSSRKTQLLSVYHGQTFGKGTGLTFLYRRRTRTGEYLGQVTDHYNVGGQLYTRVGRIWIAVGGGWNQLQDGIYGGVVYNESPENGFNKERQVVRMNGARLRRWYRFFHTQVGLQLGQQTAFSFLARFTEDYPLLQAAGALRPESPLSEDTLPFSYGARLLRKELIGELYHKLLQIQASYTQYQGRADSSLMQSWDFRALEVRSRIQVSTFSAYLTYRHWLNSLRPAPTLQIEGRWQPAPYEVGLAYIQRNLPWIAYQRASLASSALSNEVWARLWISWQAKATDTTIPPFSLRLWASQWNSPWLAERSYQQREPIRSAGITLHGGLRKRAFGFVVGSNLQRVFSSTWSNAIPLVSGWIQPFIRWQLRKAVPVYHLGIRISGFTTFHPLSYDLSLGSFYLNPAYSNFPQKAYAWIDPYLVVLVRRVMVYLRVEHANEGLWGPGYYLTAWYPMPGRAFSFGVQWDIYN
ncbi:MAG: putative porin [Bacteroidia bacterium]|nr:putative porin [Bacteroidia bacterium]MCX7764819.1 putative porin [Bacteroidia bacterium]MDW8057516.1 putative porin [Bacteroidia bacterium]